MATSDRPRYRDAWPADLARYVSPRWSPLRRWKRVIQTKEIWIIYLFRLGGWVYFEAPRPFRPLLKLFWKPWNDWVETLLDTHIGLKARIGPGLYIGHSGGIWINPNATLGAHCNIAQGVVIGAAGTSRAPSLGDRVWVGPHAVITGPVKVGNEAVIGANSLVVLDVPDKASVIGVPAKVIGYPGSARLVRLPDERTD